MLTVSLDDFARRFRLIVRLRFRLTVLLTLSLDGFARRFGLMVRLRFRLTVLLTVYFDGFATYTFSFDGSLIPFHLTVLLTVSFHLFARVHDSSCGTRADGWGYILRAKESMIFRDNTKPQLLQSTPRTIEAFFVDVGVRRTLTWAANHARVFNPQPPPHATMESECRFPYPTVD